MADLAAQLLLSQVFSCLTTENMSIHTRQILTPDLCVPGKGQYSKDFFTFHISDLADSHRIKITDVICSYYK